MKHLLETSLKPAETLTPEKVTFMFQESFKKKECKYLISLIPDKTSISLIHQCFSKCFKKIGYFKSIKRALGFLKQITVTVS